MDWYLVVFEVIDARSFTNLWFWIVVTVLWSSLSHWILGVPYDMVIRARHHGGQAMADLEDITRINTGRILRIVRRSGVWLFGAGFFVLSGLAVLGFLYGVEFAQAIFLLGFPLFFVVLMNLSTAWYLARRTPGGAAICARLRRQRFFTQLIGIVSIILTSVWGMYHSATYGVLGR